ncbi:MAG TPA: type II toxin-antitoxin system VapB family antitoxin [Solirubrobacteraceae bacterium]|nr:type II toxin-antitoxin system VapB family antitoxin [Solirubrobacteraceae bacterium]
MHPGRCIVWCIRTNIEIDDAVLQEAQALTGTRTKRETVDLALRELVSRHRRIGVLDLRGRVHWDGDLEESRRGRS